MDLALASILSEKNQYSFRWSKNTISSSPNAFAKADILILDEPTNHLDIDTLSLLEHYLPGYAGALLIVSHDRYS